MLVAVIAALITIIVLVGIISVVISVRSHRASQDQSATNDIAELENIGVSKDASIANDAQGDVRVRSGERPSSKPSDSLSRRFAALGVLAGGIFALLGAKAWTMQVMSSDEYSDKALDNLMTSVSTPAPRGCIYDRNGLALVNNRTSQTVLADPDVISDPDVMRRLSAVLGIPLGVVRQRISDSSAGAQSKRVVASDVRLRDVAFISEHADSFEGVSVESRTVRDYPYGALASHLIGYTGSPSQQELDSTASGRVIESTDVVGKSGVELQYDNILSGDQGQRQLVVDAQGNTVDVISETSPVKGFDLHLTIDAHAQYVADMALAQLIAPSGDIGTGKGVAGAVVAMNMKDGGVLAMASYPTFDPTYFTNGIPQEIWDLYNTDESNAPMINRVVNGQYAAASTFKAFTSMAGLQYGFANYDTTWNCTGSWDGFGSGDIQKCWNTKGHGTLDLHGGIVNSCDVVFYEIAKAFFDHGPEGTGELSDTALQDYIKQYRFGSTTGIDLADESIGRIPTPEWKAEHWKNVPSEAIWVGGDYSNMIIGQGDVLITPLQLAVAYGGIATGKIVKPHLMKEVKNNTGDSVVESDVEVVSEPDVNQEHLKYVCDSLHDMVSQSKAASEAFYEAGIDPALVSGKSGTAEHADRIPDAWFVTFGPYEDPRYVVVCVIEQGDGGADNAAPVAAKVMSALLGTDGKDDEVGHISGSSGRSVELQYSSSGGRQD